MCGEERRLADSVVSVEAPPGQGGELGLDLRSDWMVL